MGVTRAGSSKVELYVLYLLHIGTLRLVLGVIPAHPNAAWMAE